MLKQNFPQVNIHLCPACQLPHHWMQQPCTDKGCPWTHYTDSYGLLAGTIGECRCTIQALWGILAQFLPASGHIGAIMVKAPTMALATVQGGFQPTSEEWVSILEAILADQRGGFGLAA